MHKNMFKRPGSNPAMSFMPPPAFSAHPSASSIPIAQQVQLEQPKSLSRVQRQKILATKAQWNQYFDEKHTVKIPSAEASSPEDEFRVYTSNWKKDTTKTVLVLIHGGGLSSMSWALCAVCR